MQVSIESVGALGRKLKVAVPAEDVEKEFGQRLKRLSQQVKVPGFRPGKVPLKVVEAQYGGRLIEEVASDLIKSSLRDAIVNQGLRLADGPYIEEQSVARGQALEYTVALEVFPEIARLDISGVAIERPVATIAAEDVERTLDTMRRQRTQWNPVARAAANGDRIKIDFAGNIDGTPIDGGSAKDHYTVLGAGTLIEDLDKGMLGMTAGETRRISASFPADYRATHLAGKTANFEVTAHEVAEPVLPTVDATFAQQLGIENGDVDKLRADIQANLEREATQRARRVLRVRALKALMEGNGFEVPNGLVESEMAGMRRAEQSAGVRSEESALRERARQRVALGLALAEVVRTRGIKAEPARVRARIEEMAAEYESPDMFIRWHYEQPQRLAQVESLVVEELAVAELLAQAKVNDKSVSFQELLALEAQG